MPGVLQVTEATDRAVIALSAYVAADLAKRYEGDVDGCYEYLSNVLGRVVQRFDLSTDELLDVFHDVRRRETVIFDAHTAPHTSRGGFPEMTDELQNEFLNGGAEK